MTMGIPGLPVVILLVLKIIGTHADEIYIPKTTNGNRCVIPFIHKNKLYHDCTSVDSKWSWCYIDESFTKWDYCSPNLKFKNCKVATPNVTIEEIKEILDEHNAFRSKLPALRMRKLSWNTELAHRAQAAANRCKHDHVEASLCGERDSSGQNLYFSYNKEGYPEWLSWKDAIYEWSSEKQYYNRNTGECQANKLCGHYTQVAWDRSYLIGCGKSICHGHINGQILYSIQYYCNYHYKGNIGNNTPFVESEDEFCQSCYLFDSKEKFRCDSQNLCETCNRNNLTGCQGFDDILNVANKGNVCIDTDMNCRQNLNLCENYRKGINLPKVIVEYIHTCKKTCGLCS